MSKQACLEGIRRGFEIVLSNIDQLLREPDEDDWVDQSTSPLGRRRHCKLAKEGALEGARRIGRKWSVRRRVVDTYIEQNGLAASLKGDAIQEDLSVADALAFRAPRRGRAAR